MTNGTLTRRLGLLEVRLQPPEPSLRSYRVVVDDHATDDDVEAAFATTYPGIVRMPADHFTIRRIVTPEVLDHG